MGAYYRRNGVQVQLKIFPVSSARYIPKLSFSRHFSGQYTRMHGIHRKIWYLMGQQHYHDQVLLELRYSKIAYINQGNYAEVFIERCPKHLYLNWVSGYLLLLVFTSK